MYRIASLQYTYRVTEPRTFALDVDDPERILFEFVRYTGVAQAPGLLYLRINDDLLGDNQGQLSVDISVTPAPTPERP